MIETQVSQQTLDLKLRPDQQRVVIVGDANCGKSVLTFNVYKALRQMDVEEYPYTVAVTVDGEGRGTFWFQETMSRSPNLGLALKDLNKGHYSEAHFKQVAQEVAANDQHAVLLLPIGGVRDAANLGVASFGTQAVIVHREQEDLKKWREFCEQAGVAILAEVRSDLAGVDELRSEPDELPLRLTAAGLERGADVSDSLAIQRIAEEIVANYRGLRPAPVYLDQSSLPVFEPTYLVKIESQFSSIENQTPVALVRVGFNQIYRDVPGDQLLRDACLELDRIKHQLPNKGIVLFDGPASAPIAVALSLRAASSDILVAWRTREGGFVSVNKPDGFTINGTQVPYGSVFDELGNLKKLLTTAKDQPFERFDVSLVEGGVLMEIKLGNGFEVHQIMQACLEHVERYLESSGTGGKAGTLYISGALPIAVTAFLADTLDDKFERFASFVPDVEKYLCYSDANSSENWLAVPQRLSPFAELISQPVTANDISGANLTLVTASMNKSAPRPTNQLIEAMVAELRLPSHSDGLYINGPLPIAASVVLADVFLRRNPDAWIANFLPYSMNYMVAFHQQSGQVGRFVNGPQISDKRSLLQVFLEELEKNRRLERNWPGAASEKQQLVDRLTAVYLNEQHLSRTLSGIYDTSASDGKPPLLLSGYSLARKATLNLLTAYVLINNCAHADYDSPQGIKDLFFELREVIQKGLLSPNTSVFRSWDPPYVEVRANQVESALDQFFEEYHSRLNQSDKAIFNYSWTLRTLDREIHPLADGVGRISRLMATLHLLRHDRDLPSFSSREQYYQAMESGSEHFDRFIIKYTSSKNNLLSGSNI